ncbi:hypothetical protein RchiOBHm_Chr2g0124761 [Rosa chinensis]|uniref:Uncharacterized protein n=1 Tax=Rosa chinensis TaxID=74649 RepID=A0A2P6RTF9_ROSCH|nr:hypothetical protein RchiOBHm_Chr2g0124761 [Rosa chinensis]
MGHSGMAGRVYKSPRIENVYHDECISFRHGECMPFKHSEYGVQVPPVSETCIMVRARIDLAIEISCAKKQQRC